MVGSRHGWRKWGVSTAVLLVALVGPTAGASTRSPLAGQSALGAELQRALDSAQTRLGAPGAQAAVVVGGKPVWCGASGVTDLTSKRPVTPETPFVIASTTKTVTAAMVMREVEDRRLALGKSLADLGLKLPKLPYADQQKIKLQMLLSNHSGLADYEIDNYKYDHVWKRSDILDQVRSKAAAGTSEYVNTNWVILGGILEEVTKKPIEEYFREKIAAKAHMTSTSTFAPSKERVLELAHPYVRQSNGTRKSQWIDGFGPPTYYYGHVVTDGGLISTAADLARFGNALFRDQLVNSGTLEEMKKLDLGITSGEVDGHEWFGYSGSFGGYESENYTDPGRSVTITVTTNMELVGEKKGVADPIWKAVTKAYDSNSESSSPASCNSGT